MRFLYWTASSPSVIQSPGFTNDYKLYISVSKTFQLKFCSPFSYLLIPLKWHEKELKWHEKESTPRVTPKRKLKKKKKKKKSIGWAKCHVSEICSEGSFVSFPWWLKNVKSRSKITLFQMSAILKFDFQKRKQLHFFRKLSELHKRHNFACDNYIFRKTRANKNKQWTHVSASKRIYLFLFFLPKFNCAQLVHINLILSQSQKVHILSWDDVSVLGKAEKGENVFN